MLSLIFSPYPKNELQESEECIKGRIENLQSEIIYFQSQLNSDKVFEKSYCTSISSSLLHSPLYSPTKTMRYTNFNDFVSPIHKDSPN